MKKFCRGVIAVGLAFMAVCSALAATWTPTGATIGAPAQATFVFGGVVFSDGAYNAYPDFVLVDWARQGIPAYTMSFSLQIAGTEPPMVDLAGMRANFSSLFLTAYNDEGQPVIGRDMGLPGWVSITGDANMGYTASWIVGPAFNGWDAFMGQPIALTFAPTVDEPAVITLFSVALPLLCWGRYRGVAPPGGMDSDRGLRQHRAELVM